MKTNRNKTKAAMVFSSFALVALTACSTRPVNPIDKETLAAPTNPKIVKRAEMQRALSQTTYDSYCAFAENFVPFILSSANLNESVALSIPDAYLAFALTAYSSTEPAQGEFLDFLGLESKGDCFNAAKEIRDVFSTLSEEREGAYSGGYNLNSFWVDLSRLYVKEGKEAEFQKIADAFDVAIFSEGLTKQAAKNYFETYGLEGYPYPSLDLPDDPAAGAVMSVFYCLDSFDEPVLFEREYQSKNHYIDYFLNGVSHPVDYLEFFELVAPVYEGEGFLGAKQTINHLNAGFFLPDEGKAPKDIFADVVAGNYDYKHYVSQETGATLMEYHRTIEAPYFQVDSSLTVAKKELDSRFPKSQQSGVFENLFGAKNGYPLTLDQIMQGSTMRFDYNGFYSCSATVITYTDSAAFGPEGIEDFTLTLDRPYVFTMEKPGVQVEGKYLSVPMIYGMIYDPNYPAYSQ